VGPVRLQHCLTNVQITGAALSNLLYELDTIDRTANRTSLLHPECGRSTFLAAGPSVRAAWGVGLWPLACWDCGFESHGRHGPLSVMSFVLSGRDLCDELITRPEESYQLWCVVVYDLETSWMRRPWSNGGLSRQKQIFLARFAELTPVSIVTVVRGGQQSVRRSIPGRGVKISCPSRRLDRIWSSHSILLARYRGIFSCGLPIKLTVSFVHCLRHIPFSMKCHLLRETDVWGQRKMTYAMSPELASLC